MCNSIVALGNSTKDGVVVFGKNSDRAPNEAHYLEKVPAKFYPEQGVLKCTFIDIPQVDRTNAVILARPCWIWGAEMGTNEHGLTIGNTAVFTKVPYETGPGLIGMDLLRLGLERASTSSQAVDVMTQLLETFGQGGNCGFRKQFYYHNSYLIADPEDAWILETAGRHWIAERVLSVRATSNTLTITTDYDRISDGLIEYAVEQGWHKAGRPFNFKKSFGGKGFYPSYLYTLFGRAQNRQNRLTQLLTQHQGQITVETAMSMLRDHGKALGPGYNPAQGYFGNSVCMHAGFGPIRTDQTTGSMVSHLSGVNPTHWLNGSSAPCTGIFKPVWLDCEIPDIGLAPSGQYCGNSLWWQHEKLHREVLKDYPHRLRLYGLERDALESEFFSGASEMNRQSAESRTAYSQECFKRASSATEIWTGKVRTAPLQSENPFLYTRAWDAINKEASFYFDGDGGQTNIP